MFRRAWSVLLFTLGCGGNAVYVMPATYTIRGTVLFGDGSPASGVTVTILPDGVGSRWWTKKTDALGRFQASYMVGGCHPHTVPSTCDACDELERQGVSVPCTHWEEDCRTCNASPRRFVVEAHDPVRGTATAEISAERAHGGEPLEIRFSR